MKTRIIILLLLLVNAVQSQAQQTYMLDLDESIAIAKMKSFEMLSLKQDLKISEANLRVATSRFKTQLYMDLTTPDYREGISAVDQDDGTTKLIEKRNNVFSGSLTWNQPLPTDGNISVESGVYNNVDFVNNNRNLDVYSEIRLVQPINALYYNRIKSGLKQATYSYDQTVSRLKREELNLVYAVSQAFYRLLLLQKREEIAKMNLNRAKEAFQVAKNKYDAGLIREVESLQTEVDLAKAQNNYDMAIIDQQSSMNNFKELIGIGLQDKVELRSNMEYIEVIVDPQKAVELAIENRLELEERNISIEQTKLNIKEQKSEGMISGNIIASYNFSGLNETSTDVGLGSAFDSSFSRLEDNQGGSRIGLSVHIPIIDWGRNKAQVQALEAALQQDVYQKEQVRRSIESEVLSLVANLNSSLQRLKLLEKNIIIAEKSFEITRLRFSDGDIDSQALALENERLNNAYQSHLSAYIDYKLMLADMMRKTLYDFVNDRPLVD